MSHPSWVCGLKQVKQMLIRCLAQSHPSWVCGLKLLLLCRNIRRFRSHPSWVCGLKLLVESLHHRLVGHTLRGCVD